MFRIKQTWCHDLLEMTLCDNCKAIFHTIFCVGGCVYLPQETCCATLHRACQNRHGRSTWLRTCIPFWTRMCLTQNTLHVWEALPRVFPYWRYGTTPGWQTLLKRTLGNGNQLKTVPFSKSVTRGIRWVVVTWVIGSIYYIDFLMLIHIAQWPF